MRENRYFLTTKNSFKTAVDLNKCKKQIRLPIIPYVTCAAISDLPFNVNAMDLSENCFFLSVINDFKKMLGI